MTPENIPSIHIWMVEDDQKFLLNITNILNNYTGMICPLTFPKSEALTDLLDEYKNRAKPWKLPNVILLDIGLPGIDGIKAIGEIKSCLPGTSIVMLTGYNDPDRIYASFRSGASGYLPKSSSIDQIIEAIRQANQGGMLVPRPIAEKMLEFFQEPENTNESSLTSRELEVLFHMAEGQSQQEIADTLHISRNTVNTHVSKIYQALHVKCAAGAVAKAIRNNWI